MFNSFKTAILLGTLTGLILIIGRYFGGHQGLVIAFIFALIMNFGSYWFSDKIVLALYRARELSYDQAPDLHNMVGELSQRAGIPKPRVYIVPSHTPNAFATGRNPDHGVVARYIAHIKPGRVQVGSCPMNWHILRIGIY